MGQSIILVVAPVISARSNSFQRMLRDSVRAARGVSVFRGLLIHRIFVER